jgi:hypothetical protein
MKAQKINLLINERRDHAACLQFECKRVEAACARERENDATTGA